MTTLDDRPVLPNWLSRLQEHADEPVFDVLHENDARTLCDAGLVAISVEPDREQDAAQYLEGRSVFIVSAGQEGEQAVGRAKLAAYSRAGVSVRHIELGCPSGKPGIEAWLATNTTSDLIRRTEDVAQAESNELLACFTPLMHIELDEDDEEYLIDEILPAQGIGFLYGPTGLGKTFVALEASLAVARGTTFAEKYEAEQGVTAYVALEAPAGVKKRLVAFKREHHVNGADFFVMNYPIEICDQKSVKGLIERLQALNQETGSRIRLVVIDTLSKAMPGRDENASKDMTLAVQQMQRIQNEVGGFVMVVAHPGKDDKKGLRGHSSAVAGVDCIWRVESGQSGDQRELWIEKLKDGEMDKLIGAYVLSQRHLGVTQSKGRAITSAIVKWVVGYRAEAKGPKPSRAQQAILDHFDQIVLEERFEITAECEGIPAGMKAIGREDLLDRCLKGGDVTTSESNAPQTIGNQIRKLKAMGILGMFDGKLWRIRSA